MKQRILLVEDRSNDADYFGNALTGAGYEVERADTGKAALEKALSMSADMILMDIGLDETDGVDIVKMLREKGDTTPVVYLTAYWTPDDIKRAMETNPWGYIAKPTTAETVVSEVRKTFERISAFKLAAIKPSEETTIKGNTVDELFKLQKGLFECKAILDKLVLEFPKK